MIAYSSNCLISLGWLASLVEGDSIINATLLYYKGKASLTEHNIFMCFLPTEQDWYNLNFLVRSTGLRLLFCLNLQQRFGQNWDPTNAAELMDFSTKLQIGESVDFELGNGMSLMLVTCLTLKVLNF